jgi:short-subunit dehydrogenase
MAEDIALVTGASSGIGEALARRLARDGRNVGLVARRADRLEALAADIRNQHAVDAHVLAADLVRPGAVATLAADVAQRGLVVDWRVNNAGFGTVGRFHELPVERELDEIALNVDALVELTGRFVPGLVARRKGVVMNISSVGGYLPSPYMATYTGTKAFVLSFSEGIAAELAGTGVEVLCVCPGVTRTEFQETAKVDVGDVPSIAWQTADEVADEAVRAVGKGAVVVNGVINKMMINTLKFVPRSIVTRVAAGLIKPQET